MEINYNHFLKEQLLFSLVLQVNTSQTLAMSKHLIFSFFCPFSLKAWGCNLSIGWAYPSRFFFFKVGQQLWCLTFL
jgi:hypothetical protein